MQAQTTNLARAPALRPIRIERRPSGSTAPPTAAAPSVPAREAGLRRRSSPGGGWITGHVSADRTVGRCSIASGRAGGKRRAVGRTHAAKRTNRRRPTCRTRPSSAERASVELGHDARRRGGRRRPRSGAGPPSSRRPRGARPAARAGRRDRRAAAGPRRSPRAARGRRWTRRNSSSAARGRGLVVEARRRRCARAAACRRPARSRPVRQAGDQGLGLLARAEPARQAEPVGHRLVGQAHDLAVHQVGSSRRRRRSCRATCSSSARRRCPRAAGRCMTICGSCPKTPAGRGPSAG